MSSLHRSATAFPESLAREDYCAARPFLADDCSYQLCETKILGADQIIESYPAHGEVGPQKFDQVASESSVEIPGEDSAILHYPDTITHGGETHVHPCRQHILWARTGASPPSDMTTLRARLQD